MGMMNGGMGMGNMGGGGVTGFQAGPFPTSQPSMLGGQPMMTPGGGMMYSQPQRPPAPNNQVALYQSPQQFLQQQYGQVRERERERGGEEREERERKREEERERERERKRGKGRENPYIVETN